MKKLKNIVSLFLDGGFGIGFVDEKGTENSQTLWEVGLRPGIMLQITSIIKMKRIIPSLFLSLLLCSCECFNDIYVTNQTNELIKLQWKGYSGFYKYPPNVEHTLNVGDTAYICRYAFLLLPNLSKHFSKELVEASVRKGDYIYKYSTMDSKKQLHKNWREQQKKHNGSLIVINDDLLNKADSKIQIQE